MVVSRLCGSAVWELGDGFSSNKLLTDSLFYGIIKQKKAKLDKVTNKVALSKYIERTFLNSNDIHFCKNLTAN